MTQNFLDANDNIIMAYTIYSNIVMRDIGLKETRAMYESMGKGAKETQYGRTLIYEMTDADANQYLWASSSKTTVLEVGGTYTLKGTVKEYTNSKNNKITILTRCKEEK